jgi:hypothetical protein
VIYGSSVVSCWYMCEMRDKRCLMSCTSLASEKGEGSEETHGFGLSSVHKGVDCFNRCQTGE